MAYDNRSLTSLIRAPWQKLYGMGVTRHPKRGWDNEYTQNATNAAGTDTVDLIGSSTGDKVLLNGAYHRGLLTPVVTSILTTAKIVTMPLFVNNDADTLELAAISCDFSVANGAALTAYVSKESATSGAPGSGSSCMSGTFDLNATANTRQNATLAGARGHSTLVIKPGEQLSLKLSTTGTSIAGLVVTLWFRPFTGPPPAVISLMANGDIADMTVYLNAIAGKVVRKVAMRWSTAGSDSGTVTAHIEKDVTTGAPAAGTTIFSAAQSVKGTANSTVHPALAALATRTMAQADRLSLDMTGTLTALAGLIITIFFEPLSERYLEIPILAWDDADGEKRVFVANDYYRLVGCYFTWSTAGGGSTTLQLEKDIGTGAPAAGTAMLNAAIDTSATANTPLIGIPATANPFTVMLAPGDGVSLEHTGTTTALAGLHGMMVLEKI